jgi:hypothetical protein
VNRLNDLASSVKAAATCAFSYHEYRDTYREICKLLHYVVLASLATQADLNDLKV